MQILPTELPGVVLIEPDVYRDQRGFFLETYHQRRYQAAGFSEVFVQDNLSYSVRNTLRGLHTQVHRAQGKLIRVLIGQMFDVAVDIRVGSPTFKRWVGVVLSADDSLQLYIPPGFAHGFCVLSDFAYVEYKCTDFYDASDELTIRWDDPDMGIEWPVWSPIISTKDRSAPPLRELVGRLPVFAAQQGQPI